MTDTTPSLAARALERARGVLFRRREFFIGIHTGTSPLALGPPPGVVNPVLTRESVTDARASFVADPFMLRVDGTWHMFFEVVVVRGRERVGEIAHATSADGRAWTYQRVVLREPHHLSYPYVFLDGGDCYMVPESKQAGAVRLYRADPFPTRWVPVATLLTGPLLDSSLVRHDGTWWMFSYGRSRAGAPLLRLFSCATLTGAWIEHPSSPIVNGDARIARPGGRIIRHDGRLLRFAQDCREDYGMRVHALEIVRLDPGAYAEVECAGNPVLAGSGRGWNRSGMHHVDAHALADGSWLACVDGWTNRLIEP